MAKEKSEAKLLQEKLCSQRKNGVLKMTEEEVKECDSFCESYKSFLDSAKTEREAAEFACAGAEKAGFKKFERNMRLEPGDKIYCCNRGKAVILAVIGFYIVPPIEDADLSKIQYYLRLNFSYF